MKYILPLLILSSCQLIQGILEWIVLEKITDYGHNLTLFCNVSNCCPKHAGWDKYTPLAQHTLFIDVKTGTHSKKYDGKVLTDGYTLVIRNLTKQDLNISYSCVYGSTLGDKQTLLEENVFNYLSTTQPNGPMDNRTSSAGNIGTTQQSGQIDNQFFSAGGMVGVISGVSVAVSVVFFIVCFLIRRKERTRNRNKGLNEDLPLLEIPKEISIEERNTYMDAIKSGTEIRQYVRIQVIGKDRVGKTSLVRRLLFLENGVYDGKSTDGIEIDRKCQIRKKDGNWFVGDAKTETKDKIRRIQLAINVDQKENRLSLSQHLSTKGYILDKERKKNEQKTYPSQEYLLEMENKQHGQEPLLSQGKSIATLSLDNVPIDDDVHYARHTLDATSSNEFKSNLTDEMEIRNDENLTNVEPIPDSHFMSADNITEKMVMRMDKILADAKKEKEKKNSDGLVECGIWDFAGQQDYYATHQTFFTPHAIYLLVADIEDAIKPVTHNRDDCDCIADYIDFWFDSVHCFCKDHSTDKLSPPVIMVCTGTDKSKEVEDKKKEYEERCRQILGKHQKLNHRRGIYFISNTDFKEEDKKQTLRLRKHISEIALEMNYFEEKLPTKWIQLENALEVLKDLNVHVYSWDNMLKVSDENMIREEELLHFLNYQHKIGNIIFFNDIREYIILRPDWLVKCFRCLVCDCHEEKRNYNLICPTAWTELKNLGRLQEILINQLFQKEPELKFGDHKTHLLNVMEKFDIVIKPHFRKTGMDKSQKSDFYYLPCMIEKTCSYTSVMNTFIQNTSDVAITPWLVLEFEFLPLAYFNHILFHYIRNYEVCTVNTDGLEHEAIYRGKAVFSLDELRMLIICFSHNAISVQIWEWCDVDHNVYKTVLNELCDNIENIQVKLRQNISYSMKAKCITGDYSKSEGRISLNVLYEKEIYKCNEHKITHNMEYIKNTWLKHAIAFECTRQILLEFDSLIGKNIPLITMEKLKRINSDQPNSILTEKELHVFLKCQHLKGRILYFDETGLDQFIIFSPTYISVALDSIVTDVTICKGGKLGDLRIQSGVITKRSIDDIWEKKENKIFQNHKEYLLGVMTHLSLLVEPLRYDKLNHRVTAEFYYVPNMVRRKDTTGYLRSNNFVQRNIAFAFSPTPPTSIIPQALSFGFVSYCLSVWAVKTYGPEHEDMLFQRTAVLIIDPTLDLYINCDDEIIIVRLVHLKNRTLIMRDLSSSILECLAVALEKIGQLYAETSGTGSVSNKGSFNLSLCCSSPVVPCLLKMSKLEEQDGSWICPNHNIQHTKDLVFSLTSQKPNPHCGIHCPVVDNDFLKQCPTDMHLRRLAMQYSIHETKELAVHLGMPFSALDMLDDVFDTSVNEPVRVKFEILSRCSHSFYITFNDIKRALESGEIQNPHTICKVLMGNSIDFDMEPEKWDLVPTEKHIDRIAPLVGNNSLLFLVELGMDFKSWEQIRYRQKERDLVKLNRDILQEWSFTFCNVHTIRPTMRHIVQALTNIGKNIKTIENALADLF